MNMHKKLKKFGFTAEQIHDLIQGNEVIIFQDGLQKYRLENEKLLITVKRFNSKYNFKKSL